MGNDSVLHLYFPKNKRSFFILIYLADKPVRDEEKGDGIISHRSSQELYYHKLSVNGLSKLPQKSYISVHGSRYRWQHAEGLKKKIIYPKLWHQYLKLGVKYRVGNVRQFKA